MLGYEPGEFEPTEAKLRSMIHLEDAAPISDRLQRQSGRRLAH